MPAAKYASAPPPVSLALKQLSSPGGDTRDEMSRGLRGPLVVYSVSYDHESCGPRAESLRNRQRPSYVSLGAVPPRWHASRGALSAAEHRRCEHDPCHHKARSGRVRGAEAGP